MAVRPLDRAVLVGQASIVARDRHVVMLAERLVALGRVLRLVLAQVAKRRRQAVGAVLARHTAEMPQSVLQALRQRREALAAEHHPGMGEARPGKAEVVEQVIQRLTGDGHTKRPHVGEVGQALPARLVLLAEDHVLLLAVLGTPEANPALQGAPHARVQLGVAAHQLLEHADRADARAVLEDRHDDGVEDIGQRVRPSPTPWLGLLVRKRWIGGQTVAGGAAEPRLGGRDFDRVGLSQFHE